MNEWWKDRLSNLFDVLLSTVVLAILAKAGAMLVSEQPWLRWIDRNLRWHVVAIAVLLVTLLALALRQFDILTRFRLFGLVWKNKADLTELTSWHEHGDQFDVYRRFHPRSLTPPEAEWKKDSTAIKPIHFFDPEKRDMNTRANRLPRSFAVYDFRNPIWDVKFRFVSAHKNDAFNLAIVLCRGNPYPPSTGIFSAQDEIALCISKRIDAAEHHYSVRYASLIEVHPPGTPKNSTRFDVSCHIYPTRPMEYVAVLKVDEKVVISHPIDGAFRRGIRVTTWSLDHDADISIERLQARSCAS